MSDTNYGKIRSGDKEKLEELRESEELRQEAIDQGILSEDDPAHHFGFGAVILTILPEDPEVLDYETESVRLSKGAYDVLMELGGDNMSLNEVVNRYLNEYERQEEDNNE